MTLFIFVFQVGILAMLIWINWSLSKTRKLTRQSTELITQYRHEIAWLTARLEALERKP